ncbi:TetR/AcrR family transcriptional regulator [Streptomyces sp. HNM0575]|uniref:TetR/AcrR family transcriptional regulator n=1 Tax=Streptomyces sp. HNM0575 TaxID=2716338 RepID=UPI00145FC61D|nr:TetR/AcrR family transcriptional regulator [Streptomyces sp. HNM0575]NLU72038.1 TetR/AcrR family transcriptional regulator [Streptomyces sp. HNM0575]
MPTARETLLEAAHTAVGAQPWAGVRMVDVAGAAGVSRQTLYNEFGTKEGLGAALVGRLIDGFVEGAARAAAEGGRGGTDPAASCAAAGAWMLRTARDEPIVRAALTGCWGSPMPLPVVAVPDGGGREGGVRDGSARTVGRAGMDDADGMDGLGPSAGVRPGEPGVLAARLCDRVLEGLSPNGSSGRLGPACEAGMRIALSHVVAPAAERTEEEAVGQIREVVRALLAHHR